MKQQVQYHNAHNGEGKGGEGRSEQGREAETHCRAHSLAWGSESEGMGLFLGFVEAAGEGISIWHPGRQGRTRGRQGRTRGRRGGAGIAIRSDAQGAARHGRSVMISQCRGRGPLLRAWNNLLQSWP